MNDLIQQRVKNWSPMTREGLQEAFSRAVDPKANLGVRFGALVDMWSELAMIQAIQTTQKVRAMSNMTNALRIRQAMDVKNRPKMDDGAVLERCVYEDTAGLIDTLTEPEAPVNG